MTEFKSFFPLFEQSNYLGLNPDLQNGTVIYTLDQNIVHRIELSNQQQVQSWTFKRKLSNGVVYDYKSKQYVGVFGNSQIRIWSKEDENQCIKFYSPVPVEKIISFDGKYTILVYKNGTCESLENCSKGGSVQAAIVNEQTHQMLNIECFNIMNNNIILTYFLRNRLTDEMEFVYFKLDHETLTKTGNINKAKIARTGVRLAGFSVVEGDEYPSVMTIWSDKKIFMLDIADHVSLTEDNGKFITDFNCLKVDKPLSIVSVSTNYVALYGGNIQQEGASLVLYNTLHHMVETVHFCKVHYDNCRLRVIGKYIFIAVHPNLSCAQFRLSPQRSCDLLGTKRSTELNAIVDKDSINEESELDGCLTFNASPQASNNISKQQNVKQIAETKQQKVKQIAETKQPTERIERFNGMLRSLYDHDIPVDIVKGDSLLSKFVQTRPVINVNDQLYSFEEIALLTDELERRGASETEITEFVVPLLIKAQLPNELEICLRKYTNISDQMLVKCLKFFISMKDSSEKWTYINLVLSCSFNEKRIKEYLRTNLNLENVIDILKHIHSCLIADDVMLERCPQLGDEFDCDAALINWFVVILDAHYQQFILARDPALIEMLTEWKTVADMFILNICEIKPVIAKLQYLVKGKAKQNENQSSKYYSVEVVKLY